MVYLIQIDKKRNDDFKKGSIVYDAFISVESEIGQKSEVEIREWHIFTINKKGIYLRRKDYFTWGRKSKSQGDIGWLPVTSYARLYSHKHFENEAELKKEMSLSKSAAYRSVLMEARKYKKDATRILNNIEKAISKLKKKR